MSISTVQYLEMLQRTTRNNGRVHVRTDDAVAIERDLQERIEDYCKFKLWPYVRTRMDKATTFTLPGVPDFVIAAEGGITLFVECKSATGKQTPAQAGFEAMLKRNGHGYGLVRSFREFLEFINLHTPSQPKE